MLAADILYTMKHEDQYELGNSLIDSIAFDPVKESSSADEQLTKKIKTAASFMDILVTDHLILSADGEYYSFADEELI